MQDDTGKRTGGHVAGTVGIIFLLVYFLFPVVFILPFNAIYGRGNVPPQPIKQWVEVFLWPDIYLYERVPIYRDWLDKQFSWAGLR